MEYLSKRAAPQSQLIRGDVTLALPLLARHTLPVVHRRFRKEKAASAWPEFYTLSVRSQGHSGRTVELPRLTCPGDMPCMLPLLVRRSVVNDAPRPSAASAADSVGPFLSLWCIQPVSL